MTTNVGTFLNENRRYIYPVPMVGFARITLVLVLAELLGKVPVGVLPGAPSPIGWLRYFFAWDSAWYWGIATTGWTQRAYAFFPMYPMMMKYIGALIGDPVLAGFLISNVLGLVWLPFFQKIAENYMPPKEAMGCTLIVAFFPYVLIFTSLVYTESLFLFSTIVSWFSYTKNKPILASVLAAVATLTKTYGVLIILPMLADTLRKRNWKRIPNTSAIPIISLLGWSTYLYFTTGDPFAYLSVRQYWGNGTNTFWWMISPILTGNPVEYVGRSGQWYVSYGGDWLNVPYSAIVIVALFGILTFKLWDLDWRLATYSSGLFMVFIIEGFLGSLVRFFAFAFPIWLIIRVRSQLTLVLLIILFSVFTIILWYQFLIGWIG